MNIRRPVLVVMMLLIAFVESGRGAEDEYEYLTSLSYYSCPVTYKEWSITVYRKKQRISIDIDNYQNRTVKQPFDGDQYLKLVDFLNRKGIWRLKGNFSKKSKNCYYEMKVSSGGYSNSFRIESGPVLSGESSRYREMIRYFTNIARTVLEK
jgi:hypothetical protein